MSKNSPDGGIVIASRFNAANDDAPSCGILLTKGYVAIVDAVDYAELSRFRWCCSETRHKVYAVRVGMEPKGVLRRIYMHQHILDMTGPAVVSFRNGDSLDYRRHNLRPATQDDIRQAGVSRRGRSRDDKAAELHGEFARLNFPRAAA